MQDARAVQLSGRAFRVEEELPFTSDRVVHYVP